MGNLLKAHIYRAADLTDASIIAAGTRLVSTLVGAASLAGIVVNNSILLVQFIKAHIDAGLDVDVAAGQASRDRFRAILVA